MGQLQAYLTRRPSFSIFLALVFLFCPSCNQSNENDVGKKALLQNLLDVDFDRSMGGKNYPEYRALMAQGSPDLRVFKRVYMQNKPSRVLAVREGRIPKSIHQIWLGPKPVPQQDRKSVV